MKTKCIFCRNEFEYSPKTVRAGVLKIDAQCTAAKHAAFLWHKKRVGHTGVKLAANAVYIYTAVKIPIQCIQHSAMV